MSTEDNVNNWFNQYVGTYIAQQSSTSYAAVIQNIQNLTYSWTVSFDGTYFSIGSWSVPGITSPSFVYQQRP
jgi:hypothetical protein